MKQFGQPVLAASIIDKRAHLSSGELVCAAIRACPRSVSDQTIESGEALQILRMDREARALMLGADSDTDTEFTEFNSPAASACSSQKPPSSRSRRHGSVHCPKCPCQPGSLLAGLLLISLGLNLIFISVLLISDTRTNPGSQISPPPWTPEDPQHRKLSVTPPYSDQLPSQGEATPRGQTNVPGSSFRINLSTVAPPGVCGSGPNRVAPPTDPGYFNIFQDLSFGEIGAVVEYLTRTAAFSINLYASSGDGSDEIFGIELYVPEKQAALGFLDNRGSPPVREALVTIELHRESPPVVMEYVVGPLPRPTYHHPSPRSPQPVPLDLVTRVKMPEAYRYAMEQMTEEVQQMLRDSFGVSFSDCRADGSAMCLIFLTQKLSFGVANRTTFSLSACYNAEFPTIHPVPFQLIVSEHAPGELGIQTVFYAGSTFGSLQELVTKYAQGATQRIQRTPPSVDPTQGSVPGSINLRGRVFPRVPHAPPRQYEPQGPRYSVQNQHVRYLQWTLNLRMSVASGPQLWDVRWAGERVLYELSLQEVVVLYAGANPMTSLLQLSDSAFGLGDAVRGLVPGVDCPEHATFLAVTVFNTEARRHPYAKVLPNGVCVYEHNTGLPLRRHRTQQGTGDSYYGGLVDHALVVRTVIVEYNYDYILDFVFHANGALETKVYATGYLLSQWFHYGEDPFGFRVHDDVVGSLHNHLFHFKLDVDIGGIKNRYETLDLTVDERQWPWMAGFKASSSTSLPASLQQISFRHHVRNTEREAADQSDGDQPKYHIFYNDHNKNKFGNPRAYRLDARGYSKQILPDAHPALRSRKWTKYPLGVTQRKEEEARSSSIFSMYDGNDPVVDFERYLMDNDSIVDQDLVAWVTLGFYHIPHTEDIPNTPTLGTETSILLLPFNYFPEDPSMGSRDAVRAETGRNATTFWTYGSPTDATCQPRAFHWFQSGKR